MFWQKKLIFSNRKRYYPGTASALMAGFILYQTILEIDISKSRIWRKAWEVYNKPFLPAVWWTLLYQNISGVLKHDSIIPTLCTSY